MSRCRFLIDECVPGSLIRGLARHLPEVSAVQVGDPDAPRKSTPDPQLLEFCEQEKRLFVTVDRASVPGYVRDHLEGGHHTWGVLVIGRRMFVGQILDELTLIYEVSEDTEWIDVLLLFALVPVRAVRSTLGGSPAAFSATWERGDRC